MFDSLVQSALQPSILDYLSPEMSRGLFMHDLNTQASGMGRRHAEATTAARQQYDRDQAEANKHHEGFGYLSPAYQPAPPRFVPPGDGTLNQTGYMLRAIQRDNAVGQYDRGVKARAWERENP